MFRSVDAHYLHFVKLVQTVESAHILTVTSGFAAEAGRIGTTLDGEFFLVEYLVAENVGYRHLGSRYEVEIVQVGMIHLAFLIGQLSCAIARSLIDDKRGLYLQIACFACFFKEKSFKGTLETGHLAKINGESGSRDFHAQVEIHKIVFLQKIPMAECIGRQFRFLSALFHDNVVARILTFGHVLMGNIGDGAELFHQFFFRFFLFFFQLI